jgi:hypothetical protein
MQSILGLHSFYLLFAHQSCKAELVLRLKKVIIKITPNYSPFRDMDAKRPGGKPFPVLS